MRPRTTRAAAAVAALLAFAASACGRAEAGGVLRVAEVSGPAEYQPAGQTTWQPVRAGVPLGPGSQVRAPSGTLVKMSSGDDSVELGGGRLRVETAGRVGLIEGSALVEAARSPMTITDDRASLVARVPKGLVRFDLGSRVAVYRGRADVRIIQPYQVPLLRELALGTGDPELRPLRLDRAGKDRWDERFLGDALELERQIEVVARSLERIYGAQVRDPAFYEQRVTPSSAVSFLRSGPMALSNLLREVDPIDVLTGVVVGLRVAGSADKLDEAFGNLVLLFRSGASWGVIAAELELPSNEVVAGLEQALTPGAPPQQVVPPRKGVKRPPVVAPPTTGPSPRGSFSPGPRPTSSPSEPPPTPTTSPTASPPPTSTPTPNPTCSPLDVILNNCSGGLPG